MSFVVTNFKLLFISLVTSLGSMFQFGYLTAVVNPAENALADFLNVSHHDKSDKYLDETSFNWIFAVVVNCYQIGFLIGTILTPFCVERTGRKLLLISTGAFDVIGGILQVISFPLQLYWILLGMDAMKGYFAYMIEPWLLIVGRIISGVGSGLSCGGATLYIQEISPTNIRGLLSSFLAMSNNITTLLGLVLGIPSVLGTLERLPYLMAVGILPAFLKLILVFCPDTPKYIFLKNKNENEARRSIVFYHGSTAKVDHVLDEIRKEGKIDQQSMTSKSDSWKLVQILKVAHLRKAIILGSVTFFALNTTGIMPLSEYSTILLTDLDVGLNFALLIGILIGVCFVITAILCSLLVEKFGRKKLLLFGFGSIIILLIILMSCYFVGPVSPSHWTGYLAGVIIIVHIGIFGLGPGTIPWYITAELVPQAERSTAQSFTQIVNVLSNFLVSFTFLPLFNAVGAYSYIILLIVPTLLFTVYLYFQLPETKNREIADIVFQLQKRQTTKKESSEQQLRF